MLTENDRNNDGENDDGVDNNVDDGDEYKGGGGLLTGCRVGELGQRGFRC